MTLSSENYQEAIDLLKNRFGNTQTLISAHMETLLNVNKVRYFDVTITLRKLYNDVETCVRHLKTLNVEAVRYGYLFIFILKIRLPDALVMIIARKFEENIWALDLVLKYFHEELTVKEACFSYKNLSDEEKGHKNFSDNERSSRNSCYSQKALNNETRYENQQEKCVFCYKDYHSPSHYKIVTNKDVRIDILREYSKCYLCLKSGRVPKICKSSYVCQKCGGKHHISICKFKEKNDNPQPVVSHVGSCRTILLKLTELVFWI